MKVFIVLSAVLAVAVAHPGFLHAPVAYNSHVAYGAPLAYAAPVAYAAAVPVEISSQYHSQDSLGQYNYGYADHLSSKAETKTFDGVTRGGYSYVDANGKFQNVEYTADDVHGFQVKASNLPVAPEVPAVEMVEAPKPVEDTPEVAQAKAEHFTAVEETKARNAAVAVEVAAAPVALSYAAPIAAYAAPAYHGFAAPAVHTYAAPAVHTYAAPAYSAYAHHPYAYSPYNSAFGYQYSNVAPAYHAYHPFNVAAPFVGAPFATPVAAPVVAPVAESDDTVEVKASEE